MKQLTISYVTVVAIGLSLLSSALGIDCGVPVPPLDGSVSHNGTELGDNITFQCNEEFSPSTVMSATCTSTGRWSPEPATLTCTLIEVGSVTLTLTGRHTSSSVIDCPGDTVFYNCSILSNSRNLHLTWRVTFPWNESVHITYNSSSILNDMENFSRNISATLTKYVSNQQIESVMKLTLWNNFILSGTEIQCGITNLDNDTEILNINSSVPFIPANLHISRRYDTTFNTTVTFQWDPETVVDSYRISISPAPLSHPITNVVHVPPWNVTLDYNVEYTANISAINCGGESRPFTLQDIEYIDCGIPSPSVNARIVRYSGTKVGDHLIMQCDEGFVPSAMMPAMCTNSGTWTPVPGSYKCTSMEVVNINLTLADMNMTSPDIDCPGDSVSYNCSIQSNSSDLHLIWRVTFAGFSPIVISYNSSSMLGTKNNFDFDISTVLTDYRASEYIESVITFRVLGNITMNEAELECSIGSLNSESLIVLFDTSAPLEPTGFKISRNYNRLSNTTVTFQCNPPPGNGPEAVVDSYRIMIESISLPYPTAIVVYSSPWNVTLRYNVEYTVTLVAVNCAGESRPQTLSNITFVDCGDPMPPIDGYFMATNGTKEGDYVTYHCDEGFIPSSVMSATCRRQGDWDPPPQLLNCSLAALVTLSFQDQNSTFMDSDCPGDTISYNCSINSNSKDLHLTWRVNFPDRAPIQIMYDNSSALNRTDHLDRNISTTLTKYIANEYIESVITLTVLRSVGMRSVRLECSGRDLNNQSEEVNIFASVPRSPTGFSIAKKNEAASNIMVTIDWNTLQNNNPDIMMSESYQVAITPRSLSHPISTVVNYPPLSVTLNYNVMYTVRLTVEGCAGKSHPLTMRVQYIKCGVPLSPPNGKIKVLSNTTMMGSMAVFHCDSGFSPTDQRTATCTNSGQWNPDPTRHKCHRDKGRSISKIILELVPIIMFSIGIFLILVTVITLVIFFTYILLKKKKNWKIIPVKSARESEVIRVNSERRYERTGVGGQRWKFANNKRMEIV